MRDTETRHAAVGYAAAADVPLSHPQKRIGYVEQRYPDTSLHVVGCTSVIHGSIDFDRLARAIRRFVNAYDAFRLAFAETPDGMMQGLHKAVPAYEIPLVDLSGEADPEAELERFVRRSAAEPMQLTDGVLFRFAMFRLDGERTGYTYRFHHAIADGWSVQLLSERIADLYESDASVSEETAGKAGEGENAGKEDLRGETERSVKTDDADEPENAGYFALLERERQYAASPRIERDRRFWQTQFAELPEPPYPLAEGSLAGERHSFRIDPELSAAVRRHVEAYGLSVHAWFTALALTLLHRDTGAGDLVVGMPVYNRTTREEKRLFGMFASTMPLRIRVQGDEPANDFVMRVQDRLRACLPHQKYPYDLLAQDLELRRQGLDGLFQVTVNVYNTKPRGALDGYAVETRELYAGCQTNPLDVVVHEWALDGGFTVDLKYRKSCFDAQRIEAMAESLQALLGGMLADGGRWLADLPMASGRTLRLLEAFNDTHRPYPEGRTLHGLFESQAALSPKRIAVECAGYTVSYEQLNEVADRIAARLRAVGAGPGTIVGILAERSPALLAGIYGILKAGAAYLPLDPAHPEDRIAYSLADSGAGWLLVSAGMRDRAAGWKLAMEGELAFVELDAWPMTGQDVKRETEPDTAGPAVSRFAVPAGRYAGLRTVPENLAYLIYTSGSTGKPKGVMIEHGAAVNFVEAMAEALPLPDAPVVLGVTTVSFDIFVTESLLPLSKGMRVVLATESELQDVDRLRSLIARSGVNVVQMTPSRMQLLLEDEDAGGPFLGGVKVAMLGGEPLPPLLLTQLRQRTEARLFNMYGPTETTVWSTMQEVTAGRRITVGRPIANTQVLILDRRGELLPVGTAGELCIAGAGLALGYHGRDELTDRAFAAHPLAGGKLYRTGDLARWLPDGTIEHLGRIDRQVKIRGYRIEPGEIESCLLSHDAVWMAAVVDREDAHGIRELYAYYTASRPVTPAELRTFAARWLPAYMIPAAFAELAALPLTPSGKVDRRALADLPPGAAAPATRAAPTAVAHVAATAGSAAPALPVAPVLPAGTAGSAAPALPAATAGSAATALPVASALPAPAAPAGSAASGAIAAARAIADYGAGSLVQSAAPDAAASEAATASARPALDASEPDGAGPLLLSDTEDDRALAHTIAACLSSLLPGEPLGLDDDFFAYGGHSLHVLRAVALLKARGIPAKASDLYAEPTPAGLASLLRMRQGRFAYRAVAESGASPMHAPSPIRVLGSVAPNRDDFTWEQINCFTKPMAILFDSLAPGTFDLFLFHVQFGLTFFPDGWKEDLFERGSEPHADFFELYEKALKPIFGVDLGRRSYSSEAEMREVLIEALDRGQPALVPGDLFGLYYSHHYRSEPHTHYFIVKGYDAKRDLLFVLDNMHIDDGARPVYRDFVIPFAGLYEMNRLYAVNWCADGTAPYLWSLSRPTDEPVSPASSLAYHREQLERWRRGESALRFLEREIAIEVETRQDAGRFAKAIPLSNYKSVYYELLYKLLEEAGGEAAAVGALRARSAKIAAAWEPLRLALFDRIGERTYRFADLMPEIERNVAEEHAFFEETLLLLKQTVSAAAEGRDYGNAIELDGTGRLQVINPNGTLIERTGEQIRIVHTVGRIDDTWIVKDEAPQLLLSPVSEAFAFETATVNDVKFGGCFHNGIIVKFKTKGKIMFGCARRKLLGVFYPERTDNYELYARPEVDAVHELRIEAEEAGKLRFLARHGTEEAWELLLELDAPDEIARIGLFSKTWEPTDHATVFSNVRFMTGARAIRSANTWRGDGYDAD
ncbi:non-ribosomal peptide synthetase [Cohnella hashimotonis]|uniref:Amino acid adenylation domain-containing protein n=1 Tax=Cohnella hashimotonis TaxID=2826895 RepID=A0ABT6TQX8_9BACL|nr:non-ribosomal peptide synthetase [Cohnella hashimotonis]MDI4648222.1 amino acid adenylation domain-containing protein [Cohnella hashimotonis]